MNADQRPYRSHVCDSSCAHTVDVGYCHTLTEVGGPCRSDCPHPDHQSAQSDQRQKVPVPDAQERCQRCGEPIRKTNWALGPGWNHENGDSRCYMGHAVGPADSDRTGRVPS